MSLLRTPTTPTARGGASRSVADILAGRTAGKARRTYQPVRRGSSNAGEKEARFWRPVPRAERWAWRKAAKEFDRDRGNREAGRRNGALGRAGVDIFEAMLDMIGPKGELYPCYDTLMRITGYARDTIAAGLAALKECGFLDWLRRTEPIEDAEGPGPRVRQISNAYLLKLPGKAAARVAQLVRRRSPVPDDAVQRQNDDKAAVEAMKAGMTPSELVAAHGPGDPGLSAALARLARSFEESELDKRTESGLR